MDAAGVVPSHKFDLAAVRRAIAVGWPDIEPAVPELLIWIQDMNWPIAREMLTFLRSIGKDLVPYLRPILEGDDDIWKFWVIDGLLTGVSEQFLEDLRPVLVRIATDPTPNECAEEVDVAAAAALKSALSATSSPTERDPPS